MNKNGKGWRRLTRTIMTNELEKFNLCLNFSRCLKCGVVPLTPKPE